MNGIGKHDLDDPNDVDGRVLDFLGFYRLVIGDILLNRRACQEVS